MEQRLYVDPRGKNVAEYCQYIVNAHETESADFAVQLDGYNLPNCDTDDEDADAPIEKKYAVAKTKISSLRQQFQGLMTLLDNKARYQAFLESRYDPGEMAWRYDPKKIFDVISTGELTFDMD